MTTKPHTETHPYKYLWGWRARHTAGDGVWVCELCGVVGGDVCRLDVAGYVRSVDTGLIRYRFGRVPARQVGEARQCFEVSRGFFGIAGGASPIVFGRCRCAVLLAGMVKAAGVGFAGGLWCGEVSW